MSVLDESAIQDRLKQAMRARATDEVMVLRGLVAAIKNLKIERRGAAGGGAGELGETDITQLVRREIKQREEAITFAEQAVASDLVDEEPLGEELSRDLLAAGALCRRARAGDPQAPYGGVLPWGR